jgi:DNA-directed RNA polymerase subunit M/transcription elongation factor TFIIS
VSRRPLQDLTRELDEAVTRVSDARAKYEHANLALVAAEKAARSAASALYDRARLAEMAEREALATASIFGCPKCKGNVVSWDSNSNEQRRVIRCETPGCGHVWREGELG